MQTFHSQRSALYVNFKSILFPFYYYYYFKSIIFPALRPHTFLELNKLQSSMTFCSCLADSEGDTKSWFQTRHKSHPWIHKVQYQPKQRTPIPYANKIPPVGAAENDSKVKFRYSLKCFRVHYVWGSYIEESHLNINFLELGKTSQKLKVCLSIFNAKIESVDVFSPWPLCPCAVPESSFSC